jgi:Zn-dependent protease with chaperone function
MDSVYPAGPAAVPHKLTAASRSYRRSAWLATGGLLLFVTVYFALAGWFGWTAYRLFAGMANAPDDAFWLFVAGACAAFLAVFMLKALVFVQRGEVREDIEITAAEEPVLFAFLHRLADEIGAPRPRRVYLSGQVNAGVFYDLSIANLLIPSRKNLEIGLGLVNVLTLGELKAVLAHEFGHFAQRTMAVGRWVYIAQQIAGHIVARRDALDTFLARLSSIDIRFAWIGWLLRLIIWSIRCLVDFVFRIVVLAQRTLSREMEFQADLVAVSVTGSDALIHALHRLGVADQAWTRALEFANSEIKEGRGVQDLFALQTRIIEKLRTVLDDPGYGTIPPVPVSQPESHRLFESAVAAPPKMWSTHPTNVDREINVKRTYVAASIDERSAWTLFADPQSLRERVSAHVARKSQCKAVPLEETLAKLDAEYSRAYLNPSYRGIYLGRSIVRHARSVDDLYGPLTSQNGLIAALDELYPESLRGQVEQLRRLEEEKALLTGLRAGLLTAPGGVIRHRGEEISRKALPNAMEAVQYEVDASVQVVRQHDMRCRSAYLAAATALGADWPAYLKGLLQLLHYADHVEANLLDARGLLMNTFAVATAKGRVGAKDRDRILHSADTAFAALRDVHEAVERVVPDATVLGRLNAQSWRHALEELRLPAPTVGNLGQWLNAADGWVRSTVLSLSSLRLAALEQLLMAEAQVARFTREALGPDAAPSPSKAPQDYRLLLPGSERPRHSLDWWDRFQTASGALPVIARIAAAAAIVGGILLAGSSAGTASVYVFNGLGRPVVVHLGEQTIAVPAFSHQQIDVGHANHLHVNTTTTDGRLIEQFEAEVDGASAREIYNVAGAGALISWQAAYGSARPRPEQFLGAPRWSATHAQIVLEEPPSSVQTKGGQATRDVLTGLAREQPESVLAAVHEADIRDTVLAAHARWDSNDSRYVEFWLAYAAQTLRNFHEIYQLRLHDNPTDTFNLRLEQQFSTGAEHEAVCTRQRQMAAASPDVPDLQYLAARCINVPHEQDRAFLALHQRWPQNAWLALAAGYTEAGEAHWQEALPLIDTARVQIPALTEELTVFSARLRRVMSGSQLPDLSSLGRSELLQTLRATEAANGNATGMLRAYSLLARGEFDSAMSITDGSAAEQARLLRLVAASDGARPSQIERAMDLPTELGLDGDTLLPTLALAARAGRPLDPFKQSTAKFFGPNADRVLTAFSLLQTNADRAKVEEVIRGLDPVLRGHIYVAAAILRGQACPSDWRIASRRLLFAPERPFLL